MRGWEQIPLLKHYDVCGIFTLVYTILAVLFNHMLQSWYFRRTQLLQFTGVFICISSYSLNTTGNSEEHQHNTNARGKHETSSYISKNVSKI
jgi:hypothetical protein